MKLSDIKHRKNILIEYMYVKILEEDFHAVADAACDLRELEIHISYLHCLPKVPEDSAEEKSED